MLDYHVHLWPHPERVEPAEHRLERLAVYVEKATAAGVEEIALTEHLFRFRVTREIADDFWRREDDRAVAAQMAAYFDHHATADLDTYVEDVLAAKAAGLPVVLGLEVDYYPGRMDEVARVLSAYPFDVLLGSVHWLGAWGFDMLEGPNLAAWENRSVDDAWRAYTDALAELAGSGTCDVLAHPDVIKLTGRRPEGALLDECHDRIASAAAANGLAAEISSAGWRKPVGEVYPAPSLLERFFLRGVPVTTASDTHGTANVAERADELASIARAAGYGSLRAFRERRGRDVLISSGSTRTNEAVARPR